jgi:hypothetical protein
LLFLRRPLITARLFRLHHLRRYTFTGGDNIEAEDVVCDDRRRFQSPVMNGTNNSCSESQRHATTHAISATGPARADKPDSRIMLADFSCQKLWYIATDAKTETVRQGMG